MKLFDVYPLLDLNIIKASGSYVFDDNGNEYLDMYGGHAVISIGHNHPHWNQSITNQLNQIAFYSNSIVNTLQAKLAALLGKISNKNEYQLFLCNSGAEANENALKLASFHTGRKKIVAFKSAFHGRTSLAVSATDQPKYIAPVNETEHIDFLPFNDVNALKEYCAKNGESIAAIIVEAIQGVGGIQVASVAFLQTIRAMCDDHGAVFIADEVQCGYGRTGHFFATDVASVSADIYTMAKGMGNGFPIGGIIIAPYIKAWHGMLGTTFGGNHLACAAAIAVLETFENESLLANAQEIGNYLMVGLKSIIGIDNIRGAGLIIGFDVPDEIKALKKYLFQNYHVLTGEAQPNVIRLLPSLALNKNDADRFLQKLQAAIFDLTQN